MKRVQRRCGKKNYSVYGTSTLVSFTRLETSNTISLYMDAIEGRVYWSGTINTYSACPFEKG